MATKLSDFLTEKKIDTRRLMAASSRIERFRPEDRLLRLKKRLSKKAEGKDKPEGKPRSGRAIGERLLSAIAAGKSVSGPAKQRVLRAVNRILEQRKQDPVDLRALF